MKVEKQKGRIVISLTVKEAEKIAVEFDDLAIVRDEFTGPDGPRAPLLATLIDKANAA